MEDNYNQSERNITTPPPVVNYGTLSSSGNIPPLKPANWLWQSIVATILCCLPFGVVGIIFAAKVDSLYNNGKYEEAMNASRKARMWTLTSVVAALIYYIIVIIMFTTGNLPESLESLIDNSSSYNY